MRAHSLKRLMPSLLAAPLTLGLGACGGAGKEHAAVSVTSVRAAGQGAATDHGSAQGTPDGSLSAPPKGDGDGDSPEQTAFDSDDYHSMHFGHAADPADERAIAAIVMRYYAALAAEDAPAVCSMLLEVVAEGMPESSGSGSTGERQQLPVPGHTTCATAISGLLAESHRALLSESNTLRVVGVRVRRRRASAILRFGGTAARHILLYNEGGAWKIGTLADEDLG